MVLNTFKVNNKDIRTTSMMLTFFIIQDVNVIIVNFEHIS